MTDILAPAAAKPARGPAPKAPWQVWRDAAGRLSALRIGTLALLFVPVAIAIYDYNTEGFGARPLNNVIHRTGYWALLFLMISLAVTPLRRVARFNQLVDVRRMIGVGAFRLCRHAHLALCRRPDVRFVEGRKRDRAAALSHHRLHHPARADRACRDLDRRHGSKAGRQALAAAAQHHLRARSLGAHSFLPADQGRRLGADLRRRPVRLDDRLSAADQVPQDTGRAAGVDAARRSASPSRR